MKRRLSLFLLALLLCMGAVTVAWAEGVSLTAQPESVTAAVGETARFTVSAAGDDVTYRWQYKTPTGNWALCGLTGARTDTLTVPVTAARNSYQYRCRVTGANGNVLYSDAATLTVKTTITGQPKNYVGKIGSTATFSVTASGAGLKYQWQYKTPTGSWATCGLTGAKTAKLSVPVTAVRNKYQYRCRVTGADGTPVYSNAATLKVNTIITAQPQSAAGNVGSTVKFTVTASGAGLTYQWQYKTPTGNWATCGLTGARTNTLSVPVTAARSKYQYRCKVTSANGVTVTSQAATLTVNTVITGQPQSVTAAAGTTVKFKVKATGAGLTYQWQFKSYMEDWTNCGLTGAKTATLSVPAAMSRNGKQYRCRVTGADGVTCTSAEATLLVAEKCGDNLLWVRDRDMTLIISGTGPMWDFNEDDQPWHRWLYEKVVIQDGVTTIGNNAFRCEELTTVVIPESVTSIGDRAFYFSYHLHDINLPSHLKHIGKEAFYRCLELPELHLPDSVSYIGPYCFQFTPALDVLNIPAGLEEIGPYAYWGTRLADAVIPEKTRTIGEGAFGECWELCSLQVGKKVTSIGKGAFNDCTILETIRFLGHAPTIAADAFTNVIATVYYPSGDSTWTSGVRKNYDGTLTWKPYTK